MSFITAVFLGLVQGVTEFRPVSSSGHLAVLQNIFHLQTAEQGHLFFDVLLHLGTVAAVVTSYWKDIRYIVADTAAFVREARTAPPQQRTEHPGGRFLLMLFFGTLPLFLILPFHSRLEQLYYNTRFIGIAFILTGCILFMSDKMPPGRRNERTMHVTDAILIGLAQAIATIPGISRSGSTITAGLATGQSRPYAAKYSLLLSVPAVLGANLLSLIDALRGNVDWSNLPAYLCGTLAAFVSGYFCIQLLRRLLNTGRFGKFSYYLWGVGLFALIASLF
ncbi:MAG: undecaprenyl-diphosphate phosphatase [Oscillospiraceae bacterium]|nr:undecaprenyl-diphosphate phosphatase [Oscillospiraceae bacterium]